MKALLPIALVLVSACTYDYQSLRKGNPDDGSIDSGMPPGDGIAPASPDSADAPQVIDGVPDAGAGGAAGTGGTGLDAAAGGTAGHADGGGDLGGTTGAGGIASGGTTTGTTASTTGGSGILGGTTTVGGQSAGGTGLGGATTGGAAGGSGGTAISGGSTLIGGQSAGGTTLVGGQSAGGSSGGAGGTGGGAGGTSISSTGGAGLAGSATGGGGAGSVGTETGGTAVTGGSSGTGGTGGIGGTTACAAGLVGPGGYCWDLFRAPEASASWADTPGPNAVHVSAQSSSDGNAGMFAALNGGALLDLSAYDQLWFDATVPSGQRFAVSIGDKSKGEYCHWELVGTGNARYSVDLRTAKLCWPSTCSLSRTAVREISFYSAEWDSNYELDMTLTRLGFATTTTGFGPATTGNGAGSGLNGWCWTLWAWTGKSTSTVGSNSTWGTAPSATQIQVQITDGDNDGAAGCSAQPPPGQRDLSAATYLEFDAQVTLGNASKFEITLEDVNRAAAVYEVNVVAGANTYRVPLASPTYVRTGAGQSYDRSRVCTIDFGSPWTAASSAGFTITRLAIQ